MARIKKTLELLLTGSLLCSLALNSACGKYVLYKKDKMKLPIKTWTKTDYSYSTKHFNKIDYKWKIAGNNLEIKALIEDYEIKNKIATEKDFRKVEVIDIEIENYEPRGDYIWPIAGLVISGIGTAAGTIVITTGTNFWAGWGIDIGSIALAIGSGIGIHKVSAKNKTRTKEINKDYDTELVDTRIKEIPIEKNILSNMPLKNAKLEIYSSLLKLQSSVVTNNDGEAVIKIDTKDPSIQIIINYEDFMKREWIQMFKEICNLKNAYNLLPDKNIDVEICYKDDKRKISINAKDGEKEKIKEALKKAGCFF